MNPYNNNTSPNIEFLHNEIQRLTAENNRLTSLLSSIETNKPRDHNSDFCQKPVSESETLEAIRLNGQLFTVAFKNSPCALTLSRLNDGVILDVNDAYLKLLGWNRNEVIGKSSGELGILNPQDREKIVEFIKTQKGLTNYQVNIRTKTHEIITVLLTVEILEYEDHKVILTVLDDITKISAIEPSLKKERELFEGILNTIPVMITLYDPMLKRFRFNNFLKQTLGWTEEDALDGKFMERVYPDPALRKEVSDYMQSLEQDWREFPVTAKDGSIVNSEWFNIMMSNHAIIGIGMDTRQKREAERKIKEKDIQFKILADNIAPFAWMADATGSIFWYNKRWFDYTGTSFEEVCGWGWEKVHHPDYKDAVVEKYKNAMVSGEPWEDTFPLRSKEGTYDWFLSRALPIRNEAGDIIHWFGTNTNITELRNTEENLKKAKEKAEENDKLKSAFLANMSHEIRTPMTGILGFTDLLKAPDITDEQKHSFINIIESSGYRMLQIINDLIDISKIEAKQVEINNQETNIIKLLEELRLFFLPEARKKGIELRLYTNLPDNSTVTITDRVKLTQIISNLVKNAIKFTYKGFVEFGCELNQHGYFFFIKDTGTGIPENKLNVIFEPFRQGDISWKTNSDGVGLGLSISKAYASLLGCDIHVESEPGKGSLFSFTLPVSSIHITDNNPLKNKESNTDFPPNKKILIAEDEEDIYILLREILRSHKIQTFHAKDGNEAVEMFKKEGDIDLILMDSKMPNLNGAEATQIIRRINEHIPIIAISAYSTERDKQMAFNIGYNDYLIKPMSKKDLIEKVAKHIK